MAHVAALAVTLVVVVLAYAVLMLVGHAGGTAAETMGQVVHDAIGDVGDVERERSPPYARLTLVKSGSPFSTPVRSLR